jgi:UDP-2-acetamido-2,6-beta-L-arabino-hexul-4-ose reductase
MTNELVEYPVSGRQPRVLDIPPGWAHSIENTGEGELVTLFWASEIFDPSRPDTYFEEVLA